MIIDTHTHFYDPSRPEGVPWPGPDNELLYRTVLPADYRQIAEPEGVTGTVVVEASAWLDDNQWILDLAEEDPFIVGLVGHVDPARPEFRANLKRFSDHPRFCGIRCGGGYFDDIDSGSFVSDMRLLSECDLALDVLVNPPQFLAIASLAREIPALRIIVNHTGHGPINGETPDANWMAGIKEMADCENVHLKVSAVMEQSTKQPAPEDDSWYALALEEMWSAFGQDRLIYGSNWPVCERAGSFKAALGIVRRFFDKKGPEAREDYFCRNAERVYRWG
ncbi:MAG: amidohydrolase family protein [Candidatus Latescibacterota bacterium]|nr:amidohydrolase family protein [Candidatus Latescibacterota bacterium]